MQKKLNYVYGVLLIAALVLGVFGMAFPDQAVPPDVSGFATYEDLALLQRQIETMDAAGGTAFTVSADGSYSTACYREQGGATWVAGSGCTWATLSGSTFEIQSGTTVDAEGSFDFTGATITGFSPSGATVAGNQTITGNLVVSGTSDLVGAISSSTGAVTVTDALQVNGNATLTGTLTLESVAFSGPVRFGTASSVVSGTEIAHGLAVTPTSVVLTPLYAGAFTNTVYVVSTNATSVTVGLGYTTGVTTITTLNWMAGK